MIGATEILIIGGVVFVLFGATAIPKFAKSLGKAKREFQKGVDDGTKPDSEETQDAAEEKKSND